jgi:hypothetical protein
MSCTATSSLVRFENKKIFHSHSQEQAFALWLSKA